MQPKTRKELQSRRTMIEHWAQSSFGLMGRSPDYLNSVLMSFASSTSVLIAKENCFPEHVQSAYERAREQDLTFTHTFINPQVNRGSFYFESTEEPIAAKIIETTKEGLIIKGAKLLATQGGLTDEILVVSAPSLTGDLNDSFAFTLPSDTQGIRFICRESFVTDISTFNYPLSSRFEEIDSIVVFDNVLVPWNRVFFYRNSEVSSQFFAASSFHPFTLHQVTTRQVIKTEFMLDVTNRLIRTINVHKYPHIQNKLAEIIIGLETMRALLHQSEHTASLDHEGYMRPNQLPLQVASNLYPTLYPRFSEIIQLIGASGLITLPTENAFHSEIQADLHHYLQGTSTSAKQRVHLFRLAWDLTMSPFGTRQTQYERYFFGDPERLSGQLTTSYFKNKRFSLTDQLIGEDETDEPCS